MSKIEHTANSDVTNIPLLRRISEIMDEKGDDYSIRKFSTRLAMSRETFRLIMVGERHVTPAEIEDIANGLGITVERLKQMDTLKKRQELVTLLKANKRTKTMLLRAHSIAMELLELAIGITERGYAINNLGRALYLQRQYNEAHVNWMNALEYAKRLQEQFNEKELLNHVTTNLMLTYTIRKEYSHIEEILTYVETVLPDDPEALGMAYSTRMRMQNDLGNLALAKKHAYRSLEHFEHTDNIRQIGIALINVAHCEYLLGDCKASARALSYVIKQVKDHEDILVLAVKNYVKTLIKLSDFESAINIVERYEQIAREYPEYWGKLQIMYTVLKDDPVYAKQISNDKGMSVNLRYLSCKCLFEYFLKNDDAENAMKYYKDSRIYLNSKGEFFDEEGF